ncbi:uncharacterized protein BCR38DRAFT_405819 [Pseudomassariella vexata]|uniref:Uncharacterized protein n=1 Tax=Pseudomassariella vexata TaxID=1141098 RepID=A0A1Y2EG01_9PEZI|nr:uncharacterized protein BCR38DRAFT_405819 [Pseudomassariella vexata]ORY70186.1 hypothetical protein BCR38DRAFT_405819 [Pseudomassariella vexata]
MTDEFKRVAQAKASAGTLVLPPAKPPAPFKRRPKFGTKTTTESLLSTRQTQSQTLITCDSKYMDESAPMPPQDILSNSVPGICDGFEEFRCGETIPQSRVGGLYFAETSWMEPPWICSRPVDGAPVSVVVRILVLDASRRQGLYAGVEAEFHHYTSGGWQAFAPGLEVLCNEAREVIRSCAGCHLDICTSRCQRGGVNTSLI